jgi:predicted methyltransferase
VVYGRVRFRYVDGYVVTSWDVEEVVKALSSGATEFQLTLDFGLTTVRARLLGGRLVLGNSEVGLEDLAAVEEGFAYKVLGGRLVRLDLYADGRYYKIKPTGPRTAPTLEISGIQMHRTVGVDPWTDSNLKVRALGPLRGARVLDVCTGLGYTAIAEVLGGAASVVTVEVDPNVISLAQYNPWSRGLEDPRVEVVLADATEFLGELEDGSFDAVLHDPPRISVAGELYSLEFYRELYRVLRPGGRLFHYVGEPGKHSNVSYVKGVKRRLELAGFVGVTWVDYAKGFKALKPR